MAEATYREQIVTGLAEAQKVRDAAETVEQAAKARLNRAKQDQAEAEAALEANEAKRQRLSAAAYQQGAESPSSLAALAQEAVSLSDRLSGIAATLPELEHRYAVANERAEAARRQAASLQDKWIRLRQNDVLGEIRSVLDALAPHVIDLAALEDLHRPVEWGSVGQNKAAAVTEQLKRAFGHPHGGCHDLRPAWSDTPLHQMAGVTEARQRFETEIKALGQPADLAV